MDAMSRRVVIAAALASVDRGVLASLLAWPEFENRWANGAHPHFPVIGLEHV
jgi:hypothetical protein